MKILTIALSAVLSIAILPAASAADEYKPDANASRGQVPQAFKWDPNAVLKGDGAVASYSSEIRQRIAKLARFKGKLTSAQAIKECLDEFFAIRKALDRVSVYTSLKEDEDDGVEKYSRMKKSSLLLAKDFQMGVSFIRQEILGLDDAQAIKVLGDPKLSDYRAYLDDMRRRRSRILSADAERILNLAGDTLFADVDMSELTSDLELAFKAALRDITFPVIKDEDGKDVQLNLSNYGKYRASKDRRVREDTVEAFLATLKKYQDIFASTFVGEMRRDALFAKARNYTDSLQAYLDRDNIEPEVVTGLIAAVHRNLGSLHRYVALRKKLMGLKDIHIYDLYAPVVPEVDVYISYDKSVADVAEALRPLGPEYLDVATKAMQPGSGWIDVFPNKGKESGAYSMSIWGVHPFVKLNHMGEFSDESTIAHELGHAMHGYLNNRANPYQNAGYVIMTAEIASTFNETLLAEHLLDKYEDDDQMKMSVLGGLVETIRATIFRQTMFAEFELKIHKLVEEGVPVTAEIMNKTYIDLLKQYFGPGIAIDKDYDVEWAYIPHFYHKYYVFSYATGLATGIALAEKVRGKDVAAREKYLKMLTAPNSSKPVAIIEEAGVDILKPQALDAAARLMDKAIAQIARLAAKKK